MLVTSLSLNTLFTLFRLWFCLLLGVVQIKYVGYPDVVWANAANELSSMRAQTSAPVMPSAAYSSSSLSSSSAASSASLSSSKTKQKAKSARGAAAAAEESWEEFPADRMNLPLLRAVLDKVLTYQVDMVLFKFRVDCFKACLTILSLLLSHCDDSRLFFSA
jgi:hypothetical protein